METTRKNKTESGTDKKKIYQRPLILYRERLEVTSVVCTPSPPAKGNPAACSLGPISS